MIHLSIEENGIKKDSNQDVKKYATYKIVEIYKILKKDKILEIHKILEICKIKIMQLGAFCWQNFCHLTQLDSTKDLIRHKTKDLMFWLNKNPS